MNLRWSVLHFSFLWCKFVGIWTRNARPYKDSPCAGRYTNLQSLSTVGARIARPLFTVCTGFHTNLHYPFIFHFPFSIFLYLLGVS